MERKSTIVDIAARIGITASAVSKALSNHPRISDETKQKVFQAAKELGYKKNALATGLRKGKSGLIGVVVPGVHYSFFSTAIKGIEERISEYGYNVVIVQTRDSQDVEHRQLDGLMKARVEGIIASLAIQTTSYASYLNVAKDIPIVLFDRTFTDENISEVTINDFAGAVLAVQHLVAMGYTRIAHLAGFEHVRTFSQRIKGYRFALQEANLPVKDEYIFQCAPNSEIGETAMEKLLALAEPPDAVFAASDYLACGAMQAVLKKGMKVPEDIGIVGFSNEAFTQQVTPTLSTIEQYSEKLGAAAVDILLEHLGAIKDEKSFSAQRKVLEPMLIVRQSSSRVPTSKPQFIL